jgi:hypothetical protein
VVGLAQHGESGCPKRHGVAADQPLHEVAEGGEPVTPVPFDVGQVRIDADPNVISVWMTVCPSTVKLSDVPVGTDTAGVPKSSGSPSSPKPVGQVHQLQQLAVVQRARSGTGGWPWRLGR